MDQRGFQAYVDKLGKKTKEAGEISPEYELTRLAYRDRDSVVLAGLRGLDDIIVYTNLLTTRNDIVKLLDASSLEDAYRRIENALSSRSALITERFEDHFVEIDVDLSKLPFIKYYKEDGGLYLTSSVYVACYDHICNASYHRTMFLGKNKATLRIVPRHLNYIVNKYFERGQDAPVSLVLGLDPVQELAAAMSPPLGILEFETGAFLGGETRVVKTPRYGLPIPINASIIIEGYVSRTSTASEGPFTDILLLVDPVREQPVFIPEHMYISRKTPRLIHAIVPGLWEHQLLMGFPREAHIYTEVKRVVPCVKSVRLTEGGSTWLHGVITVDKTCSEGDAKLAALTAISAHPSIKHVVVLDDDIDVDNPVEIEWALATRLKGGDDIIVIKDIRGSTLEPRSRDGIGDKVVFMAIAPRKEPRDKYRRVEVP